MKKILRIIVIAFIMGLFPIVVLAQSVSDVTSMTANPSDTSIILTWVKPSGANSTVIRYRTNTYPSSPTDGILAYNNTGFQCTVGSNSTGEHLTEDNVSALTAGQVYYFSAWGLSNTTYSTIVYHLAMSTLATPPATGAPAVSPTNRLPTATLPTQMTQAPDNTGFQLQPFSDIIAYFNNAPGGLGMPINNAWETLFILGIVIGGAGTYMKVRNFFVAYAVVFVLTLFGVQLHMVQGWLFAIEIVIGMGVWAIDHYLQ